MMEWLPNLAFLLASVPVERLLRANALSAAASLSAAAAGLPAGAGPHEQWPELVFIDRLDAPRSATKRALTNAAELGAALQRRGFAQLSIADLSFSARARKLSNAKVVVMLAGTTQVNSLFVPPGTRIIVVAHPFGFSDKWNCAWYPWLCSLSACMRRALPQQHPAGLPPRPCDGAVAHRLQGRPATTARGARRLDASAGRRTPSMAAHGPGRPLPA